MTSRLLLLPLLAIIGGEWFLLRASGSENNTATILSPQSPPKPVHSELICNCSFTVSPFCTKNSTCNANSVAEVLRKRAQLMKEIIDRAKTNPADETNNQARDDICHTLRDPDIVDLVLLEYLDEKNWQPACVSFDNDHKICSLAPLGPTGAISAGEQNSLKEMLHKEKLRCGELAFAEVSHSFSYCRERNFCNGAHRTEFFILGIVLSSLLCHLIARL